MSRPVSDQDYKLDEYKVWGRYFTFMCVLDTRQRCTAKTILYRNSRTEPLHHFWSAYCLSNVSDRRTHYRCSSNLKTHALVVVPGCTEAEVEIIFLSFRKCLLRHRSTLRFVFDLE